jgi:hypothetical protein
MTKSKIVFFTSLLLLAAALAWALGVLAYVHWQHSGMQPGGARMAELRQREQGLLELAAEHGEWMQIGTRLADFDKTYLFSEANFADFRQELFDFFNQIRYKPKKSNFTPIKLGAGYTRRDIQVALTGIYPEIKTIIAGIENRERMLLIHRVQLNSILAGQISAIIDMEAYFAK